MNEAIAFNSPAVIKEKKLSKYIENVFKNLNVQ